MCEHQVMTIVLSSIGALPRSSVRPFSFLPPSLPSSLPSFLFVAAALVRHRTSNERGPPRVPCGPSA